MSHMPEEGGAVDTEERPSGLRDEPTGGLPSAALTSALEIPVRFIRMVEGVHITELPKSVNAVWPGFTELHLPQDAVPADIRGQRLSAQTWLIAHVDQAPLAGSRFLTGRGVRFLRGPREGSEVQAALQHLDASLRLLHDPPARPEVQQVTKQEHTAPSPAAGQAGADPTPSAGLPPATRATSAVAEVHSEITKGVVAPPQPEKTSPPPPSDHSAGLHGSNGAVLSSLLDELRARLQEQDHRMDPAVLREALLAVLTSCVTGQLTLLSGPPGTGKTSIVEHLATALDAELTVTPVRPAWIEVTDLLGFYSARQERYQPTSFLEALLSAAEDVGSGRYHLLTLDELNLSRIENYGADLLSQLEKAHQSARGGELRLYADGLQAPSYPSRLLLPTTAVLIGTLNTDETTEALSPKVLDRSFVVKLPAFPLKYREFADPFRRQTAGPSEPLYELRRDAFRTALLQVDLATFKPAWRTLLEWQGKFLTPLGVHLSFRLERVFNLYIRVAALLGVTPNHALDAFTCSKVLPTVHFMRHDKEKLELLGRWREALPPDCKETSKRLQAMLGMGDVIEYFGR